MITSKIDQNTIEVIKTVPAEELTYKYDYEFLLKQKEDIIKQRDEYVGARNKEIEEVDALLVECTKLGITANKTPSELIGDKI